MRSALLSSSLSLGANAMICLSARLSQSENFGRLGGFLAHVSCSKDKNVEGFRTQNLYLLPRAAPAKAQTDEPQEGDRFVDTRVFLSSFWFMPFYHILMCLSCFCLLRWLGQKKMLFVSVIMWRGDDTKTDFGLGGETKTNKDNFSQQTLTNRMLLEYPGGLCFRDYDLWIHTSSDAGPLQRDPWCQSSLENTDIIISSGLLCLVWGFQGSVDPLPRPEHVQKPRRVHQHELVITVVSWVLRDRTETTIGQISHDLLQPLRGQLHLPILDVCTPISSHTHTRMRPTRGCCTLI